MRQGEKMLLIAPDTTLSNTAWRFSKFTKEEYKAVFDKVVSGATKINAKCDNLKKFAENADWQALVAACPNVNLVVEE